MSEDEAARPPGERHIELANLFNLRDLGGYRGAYGREVRWGQLFRADGLHRLTPDERAQFAARGIRTVVDLRRPEEVELERFAAQGVTYLHYSVQPAPWRPEGYSDEVGTARYLADRYVEMTRERGAEIAAVLRHIADAEATPLVFHCAAGKDRTGVIAALTLSLLGVSDDDVAQDYGLSAQASPRWMAWARINRPALAAEVSQLPGPWSAAPPAAIRLFLTDLRAEFGSIPDYAASVGLAHDEIAHMQAQLLVTESHI